MTTRDLTRARALACALLAGALAVGPAAAQRVVYVDADAEGAADGTSWADAYTDLQQALAAMGPGDEAWVAEGAYTPTDGDDRRATFRMASGRALYGGFAGTETEREERDWRAHETVLSGDVGVAGDGADNSYHVVTASGVDTTAVLDGFVVAEALPRPVGADSRGGGVLAEGGSPAIRNSAFRENPAVLALVGPGAAVYVSEGGAPLIEGCLFERRGGDVYAEGAAPVIRRTAFRGGLVRLAGGSGGLIEESLFEGAAFATVLGIGGSSPVVRRTVFRDNGRLGEPGSGGAARIVDGSRPVFEDCLFERNAANDGGGAVVMEGLSAARFERCTFRENETALRGGAVEARFDRSLFLGCLFERNTAFGSAAVSTGASATAFVGSAFVANRPREPEEYGAATFDTQGPSLGEVLVANALFVGNEAAYGAAAAVTRGQPVRFVNVTFAANRATTSGGALYVRDGSPVVVHNAVAWGNEAPDGALAAPQGGLSLERALIGGGCPTGVPCTGVLDEEPRFVRAPSPGADSTWGTLDDDYGDLRLREGSPALDYGSAALLPPDVWDLDLDGDTTEALPLDYAGEPRVAGAGVDLGAYEGAVPVAMEPGVADLPEDERLALAVTPNPLSGGGGSVSFVLREEGPVVLAVYDPLGRRVAVLHDGPLAAGPHRVAWPSGRVAPGAYVVRLVTATARASAGLVVAR